MPVVLRKRLSHVVALVSLIFALLPVTEVRAGYLNDVKVRVKNGDWVGANKQKCSGGNGPLVKRAPGKFAIFEAKAKNRGSAQDYLRMYFDMFPNEDFSVKFFYNDQNITSSVESAGYYDIGSLGPGKSSKMFKIRITVGDDADKGAVFIQGMQVEGSGGTPAADCGSANVQVK